MEKRNYDLIECFGCGAANCSMCAVWGCTTEGQACAMFIHTHGMKNFINKVVLPKVAENVKKEKMNTLFQIERKLCQDINYAIKIGQTVSSNPLLTTLKAHRDALRAEIRNLGYKGEF